MENNNMQFDVIVGNPPYQLGANKSFYTKFIMLGVELLNDGGYFSMITPHTWIDGKHGQSSTFKHLIEAGTVLDVQERDPVKIFNIALGKNVSFFTFIFHKSEKLVSWQLPEKQKTPSDVLLQKILKKCNPLAAGTNKSIRTKNTNSTSECFEFNKSDKFCWPVYLSSKLDRQCVWSDVPAAGQNNLKLVVAHIITPGKAEYFSAITTIGAGRYAAYIEHKSEQCLVNAQQFFNSKIYFFIDAYSRSGRYANLIIPQIEIFEKALTDAELYAHFNLTQEEIDLIESSIK